MARQVIKGKVIGFDELLSEKVKGGFKLYLASEKTAGEALEGKNGVYAKRYGQYVFDVMIFPADAEIYGIDRDWLVQHMAAGLVLPCTSYTDAAGNWKYQLHQFGCSRIFPGEPGENT